MGASSLSMNFEAYELINLINEPSDLNVSNKDEYKECDFKMAFE